MENEKLSQFYSITIVAENKNSDFYAEYITLLRTVEAINNFAAVYKTGRTQAKGGPSTHAQQDIVRAMLIFACAGLDVLVKQLVKNKLSAIVEKDEGARNAFKNFVKKGLKDDQKELLNTIAFVLTEINPQKALLQEYIGNITSDSLQSVAKLNEVSSALDIKIPSLTTKANIETFEKIFKERNEIIHEMDINISERVPSTGYRTRRQRKVPEFEKHTIKVLELAEGFLSAVKKKSS